MKSWAGSTSGRAAKSWQAPNLSLFNTASMSIDPIDKKEIYRLYICGITPYDATHLGHASTYVAFDLINRFLRFSGATVLFVENITDIDEPLLERARRDLVNWQDLAHSQIELFRGDMVALRVLPPDHFIGVVEAMDVIISSILLLQGKGSLYLVDKDLYFRVRLDSDFLKRSHISLESALALFTERGGDPNREGKEDPLDALVWRAQREGEPSWPSPFGMGRPGWHIECSAIALHFLQPDLATEFAIDIQGGGSDLIFPHHDMSASQGVIATGQKFARSFVHSGMIGLDGEKMSKSRGNLIFVSQLINDGVDPMAIRIALMSHHYRSDYMWDARVIDQAQIFSNRLRLNLSRVEVAATEQLIESILSALAQDLDTVKVMALLQDWCEECEAGFSGGSPGELSRVLDDLLGLAF